MAKSCSLGHAWMQDWRGRQRCGGLKPCIARLGAVAVQTNRAMCGSGCRSDVALHTRNWQPVYQVVETRTVGEGGRYAGMGHPRRGDRVLPFVHHHAESAFADARETQDAVLVVRPGQVVLSPKVLLF